MVRLLLSSVPTIVRGQTHRLLEADQENRVDRDNMSHVKPCVAFASRSHHLVLRQTFGVLNADLTLVDLDEAGLDQFMQDTRKVFGRQ